MFEEAAHRLSIYLTHEENKMLAQLLKHFQKEDLRGQVSKSYVVAVGIRKMHAELFSGKEGPRSSSAMASRPIRRTET